MKIQGHTIEIGYVIHPEYQGYGYTTEAVKAVIQDLFQMGYQQVIAGAFESNTASFRVMQKCGMKPIDKEEDILYHGIRQHCLYYEIKQESSIEALKQEE